MWESRPTIKKTGEIYKKEKTVENKISFDSCADYLDLSLKHAIKSKKLTEGFKESLYNYIGELLDD